MSVWDDHAANMLWLDSVYPPSATWAGAEREPCATDSGDPSDVETKFADAYVSFMNIKFGEIGSAGGAPSPVPPSPGPTPAPTHHLSVAHGMASIVAILLTTAKPMRVNVQIAVEHGAQIACLLGPLQLQSPCDHMWFDVCFFDLC